MNIRRWILALAVLSGHAMAAPAYAASSLDRIFVDAQRQRSIPIRLVLPDAQRCRASCPVAMLSPGYGLGLSDYGFLARALAEAGHLVVLVQQDLPDDPPLPAVGDLVVARAPFWQRGADNLRFLWRQLSRDYAQHDWQRVRLLGHSNGGDTSLWLLRTERPDWLQAVITLDHRRVPLPADVSGVALLSLRSSDMPALAGVLPERPGPNTKLVHLHYAEHDQLHDGGPEAVRRQILQHVRTFLSEIERSPLHQDQ